MSAAPTVFDAAFEHAGIASGVAIWRIEKLKVVEWPQAKHSQFHTGDAYIILHTYKKDPNSQTLYHNLHYWLGVESSQDEQGVAAYKTVELDEKLNGAPVQYREVQGHESNTLRTLFPRLVYLKGGVDSGFNPVAPTEYKARLLQVKGKKNPRVFDVPLAAASLNEGDVFVLDNGLQLFQWNGPKSSLDEKREAQSLLQSLKDQRNGKPSSQVIDGLEDAGAFWALLGGRPSSLAAATPDTIEFKAADKKLLRVSDASGTVQITPVATSADGSLSTFLTSDDVYLLDLGVQLFVYIGRSASATERRKAIELATNYLKSNNLPSYTPITRVIEGAVLPRDFEVAIA